MPSVELKHPDERFDYMLRRFKKAVDKANTIGEARDRQTYEKPSLKRKRAKAAAKKRVYSEQQAVIGIRKRLY